jgi:hypothetical protein
MVQNHCRDVESCDSLQAFWLVRRRERPVAIGAGLTCAIYLSVAYVRGVRDNFGNAWVQYDHSHVIQNVVEASDRIQKAESRDNAGKRDLLERKL